jgi:asparagine synthase (glutamine-hydrolysing)
MLITRAAAESPRLDTLSYYNDAEPNWNERPYFTKVEEQRGRTGYHIDVNSQERFVSQFESDSFVASPSSVGRLSRAAMQFAACMTAQGNRVVLSGIGGDEVTGGVPTPIPELQDLLVNFRVKELAHQLRVWALNKRKPWFHLLFDAILGFLPSPLAGVRKQWPPTSWLVSKFVRRNRAALQGYQTRVRLWGPLPSFQQNLSTLEALRRQLACSVLSLDPLHEKRYPFLDRDLLTFLYSVPREQLVRPGQRRSLMRRALVGIVPEAVFARRRKAFVARGPLAAIAGAWPDLLALTQHMVTESMGIIDSRFFARTLQDVLAGQEIAIVPLMRTIAVEYWLRNLSERTICELRRPAIPAPCPA